MDVFKDRVQNEFQSVSKIFEVFHRTLILPKFQLLFRRPNPLYNARKKAFHVSKCRFKTTNEILYQLLKDDFLIHEISDDDFSIIANPFF